MRQLVPEPSHLGDGRPMEIDLRCGFCVGVFEEAPDQAVLPAVERDHAGDAEVSVQLVGTASGQHEHEHEHEHDQFGLQI